MKQLHVAFSLLSVVLLAIMNCTTDPISTAGGTETGDAMVTGMIVDGNGSPVKGATVRMVPVGFDARQLAKRLAKTRSLTATELRAALLATVDSAVTDSNGLYSFDAVDTGTYNVLADSGATMAFQDSIAIDDPDTQTTIPTDTLKVPGSLRGVVRLQPGHDSRTVFIIALGTFAVSAPSDSIGNFVMADMAEGTYSTRLLSTLDDYGVLDTSLSVTAGLADTLADSIRLPYTGIPVPEGLTTTYDTLKQLVTLTWNTPTTGRAVKGYNVYRKNADSTSFVKIAGVIADTIYVDSNAVQDQAYEYKVAVVDSNDTDGVMSNGSIVNVVGLFERADTLGGTIANGYRRAKRGPHSRLYVLGVETGQTTWTLSTYDSTYSWTGDLSNSSTTAPHSFDFDSLGNIYTINHDGIHKLDSNLTLVGTLDTWSNAENKDLIINEGYIYVASGMLRKYALDGTLVDTLDEAPAFRADGGITIINNQLFVTGGDVKVRIYDLNLGFVEEWPVQFLNDEETRQIALAQNGDIYIYGYHFNPDAFNVLIFDSLRNYKGKYVLDTMAHDMEVVPEGVVYTFAGQAGLFRFR